MTETRESTLLVCQSEADIPRNKSADIVIEEVLREFDEDTANDLYRRLVHLEVDSATDYEVPVYRIICNHIWRQGGPQHANAPSSMELLVMLYHRLESAAAGQTTRVECIGVSGPCLELITDFSDNEGLSLSVQNGRRSEPPVERCRAWLQKVVLPLFDLLLSVLLGPLFGSRDNSVLVDYPLGRPDTIRAVQSRFDIRFDTVFSVLTLSYLLNHRSHPDGGESSVPIYCFETVSGLVMQFRFALSFLFDTVFQHETARTVAEAVEEETGVYLERTVARLYRRAAVFDFDALLRYGVSQRNLRSSRCDVVLLTSSGPSGKALGLAARGVNIPVALLPHSVTQQRTGPDAQFQHTRFIEGEIAQSVLSAEPNIEPVETGLPKHLDIYDRRSSLTPSEDDGAIVVGTQPYADTKRREFVSDVLLTALDVTDREVVVKIHPGEQQQFYEALIEDLSLSPAERDRVVLSDADLYQHIVDSALMVTLNSNVGIESMLLRTPAVSYNKWRPDLRAPLYATEGAVPNVESPDELAKILTDETIRAMATEQDRMLNGQFKIRGNSLSVIAETIEMKLRDLSGVTDE